MKKLFKLMTVASIGMLGFTFSACSKDKNENIETNQLPEAAQVFIGEFFGDGSISSIQYDKSDREYEVVLQNGFELTFDNSGAWTDVDAPNGVVIPNGIAPQPIQAYVSTNYTEGINEIEKTSSQYNVELTNGFDLVFNLAGEFVRTDN